MIVVSPLNRAELAALAEVARSLRVQTSGPFGWRARAQPGRGSSLYGHEPWREGDESRHLDWRVYLRTGALWVRRFHAEGEPRLRIVLDTSNSMGAEKLEWGARLALACASLAGMLGQPFECYRVGESAPLSRWHGSGDWHGAMAAAFLRPLAMAPCELVPALSRQFGRHTEQDPLVVISDCADRRLDRHVVADLRGRSRRGLSFILMQAPSDLELPASVQEVQSPEGRESATLADSPNRHATFAAAVEHWRSALRLSCAQLGVPVTVVDVAQPPTIVDTVKRWALGLAEQRVSARGTI